MIDEPLRNSRQIFHILCPVAVRDGRTHWDNFRSFNLHTRFLLRIFDKFSRISFSNHNGHISTLSHPFHFC
uniref:Uncharacterized protein n=1 Tax=Octopus bimaculoides TaxID=37653 RepID=A0A0L8GC62_OCTBM